MLAVAVSSLSCSHQFHAFVDEHARHLHLGLQFGQRVARVLVAGHRLAEDRRSFT
jgi:hypothetical protein